MAKTPSLDAKIEKARTDAQSVQQLSAQLATALCTISDDVSETAFEVETRETARLRDLERALEADLLNIAFDLGASTQAAYAAFDKVDEVSPRNRFLGLFTKRKPTSFKDVRRRKLKVAETAKAILLQSAAIHDVFRDCKDAAASLVVGVEPEMVASMERRRALVSEMEDARQRDKTLAASLATLVRKIQDVSDETRFAQLKEEETEVLAQRGMVLEQRDRLRKKHHVLDRQAILFGDMIDLENETIALHTLLLKKVDVEAERCILLYDAAFGSLETLFAEAKPSSQAGISTSVPIAVFQDLLTLHSQGAMTMQDIERRKGRVDEALSKRTGAAFGTGA